MHKTTIPGSLPEGEKPQEFAIPPRKILDIDMGLLPDDVVKHLSSGKPAVASFDVRMTIEDGVVTHVGQIRGGAREWSLGPRSVKRSALPSILELQRVGRASRDAGGGPCITLGDLMDQGAIASPPLPDLPGLDLDELCRVSVIGSIMPDSIAAADMHIEAASRFLALGDSGARFRGAIVGCMDLQKARMRLKVSAESATLKRWRCNHDRAWEQHRAANLRGRLDELGKDLAIRAAKSALTRSRMYGGGM